MENSRFSPLSVILNTYFICIAVYFLEYKFYPRIGSIFGIAILTRIFEIIAIAVALKLINSSWKKIGYVVKSKYIIGGIIKPLAILIPCTLIIFLLIKVIVESQGASLSIGIEFDTSIPITIISVAISAFVTETMLRGFVLQTAYNKLKFYAANTINVALTIIRHSAIYIFGVITNNEDTQTLIKSFIFICLMYGVAAIRKSLYTRATGTIWACLTDCFVSLLIIDNLRLTIVLPTDFSTSTVFGKLISFMSSNATTTNYASVIFLILTNILALIVTIVYCKILKRKARKNYQSMLLKMQDESI